MKTDEMIENTDDPWTAWVFVGPIKMWIFKIVDTTVLHDLRVAETRDVELRVQGTAYMEGRL